MKRLSTRQLRRAGVDVSKVSTSKRRALADFVPSWERGDRAAKLSAKQSTTAFSRKLLGGLARQARLYCKGRSQNSPTGITRYKMVKDDDGNKVERPIVHHRAPTKSERRRGRARQARLRLNTMRSLTCHAQGRSSNPKWAS